MRKLGWLAGGVVVLLGAAFLAVTIYLGEIVATGIERGGTYALGVDTRVGLVRLAPFAGSFRMSGLRIANPPGFASRRFFDLGRASLDVDLGTLRDEKIVMPRILLESIDVVLEYQDGRTNAGAILENLKRFERSGDPAPSDDDGAARQVVVRELLIRDLTARVEVNEALSRALGRQSIVPLEIAEIRLENVGEDRSVTLAQLTDLIVKTVLTAVARQGGGTLPSLLVGEVRANLNGLASLPGALTSELGSEVGERLEQAVKELPGSVGDTGKKLVEESGRAVGDEARKALGRIGDLVGGKDD